MTVRLIIILLCLIVCDNKICFGGILRKIYFFFQAEDGIRDTSVTGVQTCALPILGNVACK